MTVRTFAGIQKAQNFYREYGQEQGIRRVPIGFSWLLGAKILLVGLEYLGDTNTIIIKCRVRGLEILVRINSFMINRLLLFSDRQGLETTCGCSSMPYEESAPFRTYTWIVLLIYNRTYFTFSPAKGYL